MVFTYDRPANHPRITIEEKKYIQSSIGAGQDKRKRVHSYLTVLLCCAGSLRPRSDLVPEPRHIPWALKWTLFR